MLKKSKIKKQDILPENLNLSFKFAKIQTSCNPQVFDDEQCKKIINIVDIISKSITIDYTFVNHKNTKYEKTFITEEGWNQLCEVLNQTNGGISCSKEDYVTIDEAYKLIMIQYAYRHQKIQDMTQQTFVQKCQMTQNIRLKLDLCHLRITIKANGKNGKMVHKI